MEACIGSLNKQIQIKWKYLYIAWRNDDDEDTDNIYW